MAEVKMADGSTYTVTTLLGDGDSNVKLTKSDKAGMGYLTVGLSLSPAKESGYEVCSSRSPGCTNACLFTSGMGQVNAVKRARIAKTILFFEQRELFMSMLGAELIRHVKRAKKQDKILACRLNVLSDLQWEKLYPDLFVAFKEVQFYDYTKHLRRAAQWKSIDFPSNYHLTFSRSETNDDVVQKIIGENWPINVAVVFDSLPEKWNGRKVINGDETDLRFLDPDRVIVGLKAKGKARKEDSGFVIRGISLPMVNA
jgi:hypothetical protein